MSLATGKQELGASEILDRLDRLAQTEAASFVITWDHNLGWKVLSGKRGPWGFMEGWYPSIGEAVEATTVALGVEA